MNCRAVRQEAVHIEARCNTGYRLPQADKEIQDMRQIRASLGYEALVNVPVRASHMLKMQGYPRGLSMMRKTNQRKRREFRHPA